MRFRPDPRSRLMVPDRRLMASSQQALFMGGSGTSIPWAAYKLVIDAEVQGATADDFIDESSNSYAITRNVSTTVRSAAALKWGSYGVSHAAASGRTDWTAGSAANFKFLHDGVAKWEIGFWLDPADFSVTRTYFDTGGGTRSNSGVYCAVSTGRVVNLQIYRGDGVNYVLNGSFTALANNTNFRFIKLQVDLTLGSANATLYEDGTSLGSLNKTGNAPSSANPAFPFRFGGFGSSGGDPFRGSVDALYIIDGYWTTPTSVPGGQYPVPQ